MKTAKIDEIQQENPNLSLPLPTVTENKYHFFPYIFSFFTLLYLELLVRFFTVDSFVSLSLLYIPLILCIPSVIIGFLCDRKKPLWAHIFSYFFLGITFFYYSAQIVVYHIFSFYISFSALSLTEQATHYYKEALLGIGQCWFKLLLALVPLLIYFILHNFCKITQTLFSTIKIHGMKVTLALLAISFLLFGLFLLIIHLQEKDTYSAYDLYYNKNDFDASVPIFGIVGSFELDFNRLLFGFKEKDSYNLAIPDSVTNSAAFEPTITPETKPSITTTPTPIVYGPNVMEIDFATLIANEKNKDLLQLDTYFNAVAPTMKNEKTGIYKGYNIIYITGEAFSRYAINETVTPTLYKMANEGYVFKNFYTTGDWYTSTSDGEFMMTTGMIPMSEKNTFSKTCTNYFAFSLPHILKPLGYTANAFHDNSGTVYDRNLTHPNLGYNFYADGSGLELDGWPQSDLEMMEQSIPMYIGQEPFHAYYMTVSGHLNYNFTGNAQAKKHEEEVAALPYSEGCRAYVACNIELDHAMQYLLEQLDAAGIADHTLIVMVGDHYPYGLKNEEISEFIGHEVETTFERYHSTLILYTPGKKDTEIITKPCEAIDVLPTVLNMIGADYDSRLLIGRDIFAPEPGLVIFPSRSFITEDYMFKFSGKEIIPTGKRTLDEITNEEVLALRKVIDNDFFVSSQVMKLDYYRAIGLEK